MRYLFFIFVLCLPSLLVSQNFSSKNPEYIKNVKQGEAALNAKSYDTCLEFYETAFKIKHTSILSTMRAAACAFGLQDEEQLKYYLDTAFALDLSAPKSTFLNMPEFESFWNGPLEERIAMEWEQKARELNMNIPLMIELEAIGKSDQEQRSFMRDFSDKYGWDSPQMDSLWVIQSFSDSVNTVRVKEMIKAYGYPGKSLVGSRLASTCFLVIQHADKETQREYLPILKSAADAGELKWRSLALLIDRVNLGKGEDQIYGSQVLTDKESGEMYFGKIANPYQIDSIRASVGLGSLQSYGDNWSIQWDPEKHIARHKALDAKKTDK